MSTWWSSATPYKGFFIFMFAIIALEYLYGSMESKPSVNFNATKYDESAKNLNHHSTLTKSDFNLTKSHQNLTKSHQNSTQSHQNLNKSDYSLTKSDQNPTKFDYTLSRFHYVVTEPTFNVHGINSTHSATTYDVTDNEIINTTNTTRAVTASILPLCPDVSYNLLGRIPVIKSPAPNVLDLQSRFPWLQPGGHWAPPECRVLKKVAIIIPYRARGEHLLLFLQHMHPMLRRQQIDYTIFVVEQDGNGTFNRAMLMNIGYVEALKRRDYDCFIFHDVDLLPEDDRNLYACPEQPRHMSVAINIFKYRLPYPAIFGGVSAITRGHFKLLNGFSNSFWGWGGEDDDMANRIQYHHLYISRYPLNIARYTMLSHKKDKPSPNRYEVLKQGKKRFDKDGLNSLKYQVVEAKEKLLYTWILVAIAGAS